jgi:hypothetical protein
MGRTKVLFARLTTISLQQAINEVDPVQHPGITGNRLNRRRNENLWISALFRILDHWAIRNGLRKTDFAAELQTLSRNHLSLRQIDIEAAARWNPSRFISQSVPGRVFQGTHLV